MRRRLSRYRPIWHGRFGFHAGGIFCEDALRSAIADVQKAIPGAKLVQVGPDLVGLTETAEIFGFSRQNMRKYATGQVEGREAFPVPAFIGEPSLWHLAEIASWLKSYTAVAIPHNVIAVSKVAASQS